MDKKTISTCLRGLVIPVLALVAMAGQAQTFTPIVEDSIDFVITAQQPVHMTVWQCFHVHHMAKP